MGRQGATIYDPLIGEVVAERYHVLRLIATGGMGAVFEAQHLMMNRRVALKLVPVFEPQRALRFKREAEILSRIDHPHAVQIYDFGEAERGFLYLSMELLSGETLEARILREGPMGVAQGLEILEQIGSALSTVHQMGVIHRDIKPDNVLLVEGPDGDDFVKLIDFGIAKTVGIDGQPPADSDEYGLTHTGHMVGTPTYMSPEQILGQAIDARSDIYSLACLTYRVWSGQPPFGVNSLTGVTAAHVREQPPTLNQVRVSQGMPPLSQGFDAALYRALAKAPHDRFRDVETFLEHLRQASSSSTIDIPGRGGRAAADTAKRPLAPPATVEEPGGGGGGRQRRLALVVAALVMALGAVIVAAAAVKMSQGDGTGMMAQAPATRAVVLDDPGVIYSWGVGQSHGVARSLDEIPQFGRVATILLQEESLRRGEPQPLYVANLQDARSGERVEARLVADEASLAPLWESAARGQARAEGQALTAELVAAEIRLSTIQAARQEAEAQQRQRGIEAREAGAAAGGQGAEPQKRQRSTDDLLDALCGSNERCRDQMRSLGTGLTRTTTETIRGARR